MRRLNKYITDAGYCSRREADTYIEQGRVTINGREASLGDTVDEGDLVEVDGEKVGLKAKRPVYIACHKPVGVTCTSERSDKTNIVDFIGYKERIFPVGRLDKDSEGLILLTNDGDIVNKILRAGNNNPKEYVVTVDKPLTQEFIDRMSGGVRILGVTTKPCRIIRKKESSFIIYLTQGLNRQIRRMCQVLGYKVTRLKRTKVLNVSLGDLEPGRWRHLTTEEVREMHVLLAQSSGTEEASNEQKAAKAQSVHKRSGSYTDYRRKGRTASKPAGGPGDNAASGSVASAARPAAPPSGKPARGSASVAGKPARGSAAPARRSAGAPAKRSAGAPVKRSAQSPAGRSQKRTTGPGGPAKKKH